MSRMLVVITCLSLATTLCIGFSQSAPLAIDDYRDPILEGYRRYRDALATKNIDDLIVVAEESDGFLRYQATLALARDRDLAPAVRNGYYRRVLALCLCDALDETERRQLQLEWATVAERADMSQLAIDNFVAALPAIDAIAGLKRLETDRARLAGFLLEARLYREALEALDGLPMPSLEARAYRRLNDHAAALEAFDRWLSRDPDNAEALLGKAWTLFELERYPEAEVIFTTLADPPALLGRSLIARRSGRLDEAIDLLSTSPEPAHLWLAADLLEAQGRTQELLELYRRLAFTDSAYADDAAYRAMVLLRQKPESRPTVEIPAHPFNAFFRHKLELPLTLPYRSTLARRSPAVLPLAEALLAFEEVDSAIGELLFALRQAEDEAVAITIAERLQSLGEYHHSQRAGEAFVRRGSLDLRTWRVAFPRAYPNSVAVEAARHRLQPEIIWAVMHQESRFPPQALSHAGAKGLMQFMPATWQWIAELNREPPGDPFNPYDNIRYSARYLAWLTDFFDGDLERVVASYNGGQGYVQGIFESSLVQGDRDAFYRFLDKPETREYLQRVVHNMFVYQLIYCDTELTVAGGNVICPENRPAERSPWLEIEAWEGQVSALRGETRTRVVAGNWGRSELALASTAVIRLESGDRIGRWSGNGSSLVSYLESHSVARATSTTLDTWRGSGSVVPTAQLTIRPERGSYDLIFAPDVLMVSHQQVCEQPPLSRNGDDEPEASACPSAINEEVKTPAGGTVTGIRLPTRGRDLVGVQLLPDGTLLTWKLTPATDSCTLTEFTSDHFVGEPLIADEGFVDALTRIEGYAETHGVEVYVTSSLRNSTKVAGAITKPAPLSNHLSGHAIDFNLRYDGAAKFCNSRCLRRYPLVPSAVRGFITAIREDPGLRWGGDFRPSDPVHIDDALDLTDPDAWLQRFKSSQLSHQASCS